MVNDKNSSIYYVDLLWMQISTTTLPKNCFTVLNNAFLFLVYSLIMQEWFDVYLILGLLALERFLTSVPVY